MTFWIWFWGLLLLVTLLLYAVLVVYVTLGGYEDIRSMFRNLAGDDGNPDPGVDGRGNAAGQAGESPGEGDTPPDRRPR